MTYKTFWCRCACSIVQTRHRHAIIKFILAISSTKTFCAIACKIVQYGYACAIIQAWIRVALAVIILTIAAIESCRACACIIVK